MPRVPHAPEWGRPVHRGTVGVLATIAATTLGASTAAAARSVRYACYSEASGTLSRLPVAGACPAGATEMAWVQVAPQGSQGGKGSQGAQGGKGTTCPKGKKLSDGKCTADPTGPQGARGRTGPTGPAGPMGAQGSPGPQGVSGTPGSPGPQGVSGAPGAQGPQGAMGSAPVASVASARSAHSYLLSAARTVNGITITEPGTYAVDAVVNVANDAGATFTAGTARCTLVAYSSKGKAMSAASQEPMSARLTSKDDVADIDDTGRFYLRAGSKVDDACGGSGTLAATREQMTAVLSGASASRQPAQRFTPAAVPAAVARRLRH